MHCKTKENQPKWPYAISQATFSPLFSSKVSLLFKKKIFIFCLFALFIFGGAKFEFFSGYANAPGVGLTKLLVKITII